MGFDEQIERAQADGRITVHDADEVRNFADFLTETAGLPTSGGTADEVWARRVAYARHYPEDFERHHPRLYAATVARMSSTDSGPGYPVSVADAAS